MRTKIPENSGVKIEKLGKIQNHRKPMMRSCQKRKKNNSIKRSISKRGIMRKRGWLRKS